MSRNIRDDIDKLHDYGIYLPTRTLYMGSETSDLEEGESGTDSKMAEKLIKNLHILDSKNAEPIIIIANNVGGDEYHTFAIIDAIRKCRSHVTVEVYGHAMSAGSLILQAADKRLMGKNAVQMIHYGTWGVHDHAKTAQKWAKEGERIDQWMEQWYMKKIREKHPDFKLKKLKEMLDHDTFLTARQSVDLGLADGIVGEESSHE
jgi:ATP-dependent protease ClpP protease subunit